MHAFFSTIYGQITALAGVVATLWGLFKAFGALRKWFANTRWWVNHVKRRDAHVVMLEAVNVLKQELVDIKAQVEQIKAQNVKQSSQLELLDDDMADSLCSQLTREHDYYVNELGWCSASDKKRLEAIYTRYKSRNRNHLADHYMDDIINLPEHP